MKRHRHLFLFIAKLKKKKVSINIFACQLLIFSILISIINRFPFVHMPSMRFLHQNCLLFKM